MIDEKILDEKILFGICTFLLIIYTFIVVICYFGLIEYMNKTVQHEEEVHEYILNKIGG